MTKEEGRIYFATGKLPDRLRVNMKKKSSKYNNEWTEYNGRKYQSKREARHAAELDLLIRSNEVVRWEPQFSIELEIDGEPIGSYRIDFKVWWTDGRITYDEVKGYETDLWRLKWAAVHKMYPDWNFRLIK